MIVQVTGNRFRSGGGTVRLGSVISALREASLVTKLFLYTCLMFCFTGHMFVNTC